MSDKERLEEIKRRTRKTREITEMAKKVTPTDTFFSDIEWLIEQAERVEELENHLKLYDFWYRTAYQQNKRYREALNSIITLWIASTDATDDTWLAHEMSETARKALEG